jgi:hypothetical protein
MKEAFPDMSCSRVSHSDDRDDGECGMECYSTAYHSDDEDDEREPDCTTVEHALQRKIVYVLFNLQAPAKIDSKML